MTLAIRPVPTHAHASQRDDAITIRALAAGDASAELAVFKTLSPNSRFLRFHTGIPALTPAMVRQLTDLAPERHVALVALVGGTPIGTARWVRFGSGIRPDAADLAVAVADRWHGRGVARRLLEHLAPSALDAGVREFVCEIHPANRVARTAMARMGARHGETGEFVLPVHLCQTPAHRHAC